jgi:hypothetical protein
MTDHMNEILERRIREAEARYGSRTISVEVAGRDYFGLSRNGSYDAARRGDIPTIKVGHLLRVPIAAMEMTLAGVA